MSFKPSDRDHEKLAECRQAYRLVYNSELFFKHLDFEMAVAIYDELGPSDRAVLAQALRAAATPRAAVR